MSDSTTMAHGLDGSLVIPDWPQLRPDEVDRLLCRYPDAGAAIELLTYSPRPFSAASVIRTPQGPVFVKRHHRAIRDAETLEAEHRFMRHLREHGASVVRVLADCDGRTAIERDEWTYEVHAVPEGVDLYGDAHAWTPYKSTNHAREAGRALGQLHEAARGYDAPARAAAQLVTSFTIFAVDDPVAAMQAYIDVRPRLAEYLEKRGWREQIAEVMLLFHARLRPYLRDFEPMWTHGDWHGTNLLWSSSARDARVTAVIDFGLSDRTNALHDVAMAVERSIDWLRIDSGGNGVFRVDQILALLAGYESVRSLSRWDAEALIALVPLVHAEFALSETDYFLSVLHAEDKAALGYEGYMLEHAKWFTTDAGKRLLGALETWAEGKRA